MSRARERWLGRVMLAPAIAYVAALVGLPLAMALLYSVGDVRIDRKSVV